MGLGEYQLSTVVGQGEATRCLSVRVDEQTSTIFCRFVYPSVSFDKAQDFVRTMWLLLTCKGKNDLL